MIEKKKINKKAQLSMFIGVAVILVVVIGLIFLIVNHSRNQKTNISDPKIYITNCIQESLQKAETNITQSNLYDGGRNYALYLGKKVPYLCLTSTYYSPCVNQEPMLIEKVRAKINNLVLADVKNCFSILNSNLKKSGYEISEGNLSTKINFYDKSIELQINKKISAKKENETKVYEEFSSSIQSPIFNLLKTTQKIVNYQSTYCEFNDINWMMVYPETKIDYFITSDNTKIYTLSDRASEKNISFAVKSCSLPGGV